MTDSAKGHAPILAAGGIVLRGKTRLLVAIVRLRRQKAWVLPKGKLLPRERARDAAMREVLEETGHDVSLHEFLGSMSYVVDGRIKIVQFWLMRAGSAPVSGLSDDVKEVKWLPLQRAIDALTRPHEKVFLSHVGPVALEAAKKSAQAKPKQASRRAKKRNDRDRLVVPVEREKVFLSHVGPIALEAAKKSVRAKPKRAPRRIKKRNDRDRSVVPVERMIALAHKGSAPSGLLKALGNWIERASHSLARRAG